MKLSVKQGATSVTVNIFIADSSSTTGAGLTGLVFNSAGLVAYYARPKIAAAAITLATLAAVTSAFTDGGFKEIDATNMPGWYRFDIPDAAIANAERFVSIHLKGASNMAPLPIEIALDAVNNQSATAFMTSLATVVSLTNAPSDSSGVTTLLARLTNTRAGLLDNLDAAISSRSTYAGADTAGTTTLLSRLSGARALLLDNLDAAISSRLATAGYTAPPTAAAIRAEIDSNSTQLAAILVALAIIDDFIDTEIAAIQAQIPADLGAAYNNLSHLQATKIMLAVLCAKSTGLAGATAHFRKLDDSGDALSTSIDADGNRGNPTLSP